MKDMSNRFPKSIRIAIGGAIAVVAASVISQVWCAWTGSSSLQGIHRLVNLDAETSFPSAFATCLLAIAAVQALAVGNRLDPRSGLPSLKWLLLAIALSAMSIDEWWSIHERFTWRMESWVTSRSWTAADNAQTLLFVVALSLLGVAFARWSRRFPTPLRQRLQWGAAIFLAGALGIELLARFIPGDGALYASLSTVEESLELAGVLVLLTGFAEMQPQLPSHISAYAERAHQSL